MSDSGVEIVGALPDLSQQVCTGLGCQEIWLHGELTEPANVFWIRCNGVWHRFFFEWIMLHCCTTEDCPETDGNIGEAEYRNVDICDEFGLNGLVVSSVVADMSDNAAQLRIAFEGGRTITFRCVDECTTYTVE